MRTMTKRIMAMALSLLVAFTSVPLEAFANEASDVSVVVSETEEVMESEEILLEESVVEDESLTEETDVDSDVTADVAVEETVSEVTETETSDVEEVDNSSSAVGHATVNTVDLSDEWDIESAEVQFKNKKVLLIQDTIPWNRENSGTDVNQEVLKNLAAYDVTTTAKFPKMNISDYSVIIFANDQAIGTYTNYSRFTDKMEEFAELGGIIVFGAADGGWAAGDLSAPLPGGVTKTSQYTYYNEIKDSNHPIVTGQFTDSQILNNDDLYSTYCSHVYFNRSSFPEGTKVILTEKNSDNPTLIEYPLGRGRIIASGLTWEHNYIYGGTSSSFNAFAVKALDDLYAYALYVSGISNDNLEFLQDTEIEDTQHLVIVADAKTNDPIQGATVKLGLRSGVSDENGRVWFDDVDPDKYLVTISKDGYKSKLVRYDVKGGDMRYFFLTNKTGTSAYITGAMATVTKKDKNGNVVSTQEFDLFEETVSINNNLEYEITLYGDWNNQEAGNYALYLGSSYAYSPDGKFTIIDGKCSNSKGEDVSFSDGRIHAQMITKSGNRSSGTELMLYSPKKSSGSLFGNDNDKKFSIGKDMSFTIPDNYPVIGNMDFSISLDQIPFSYEVSEGEIKLAIGFSDFSKIESPKKSWDDYVKQFETVKRTKNLSSMVKAYGGKSGSFSLKKGWDTPELEVVGYAIGKYDETTGEVTNLSGELVVSTEMKYTYSQQFVVGPVPVYFEIGGGFSLENDTKIEAILVEDGQLVVDNKLTLTPKFILGGGVGINGALSVGGKGEASLPIVLCDQVANFDDNTIDYFTNVSLKGELKLTASLLFVFNAEKSIAEGEWQILRYYWDTGEMDWFEADELEAFSDSIVDFTDVNQYQLMSRAYRNSNHGWYTEDLSAAAFKDGMTELQAGIMPTSAPQIVQMEDGKALMVFQQDDATRSSINRSCLMYSVFSNGVWSEPKAVWNNGTADMAASIASGENGTYVVWQKLNTVLEDTASIETMAAACEIASAKFNPETGEFENAKYETNDDKLQMLPTATVGDNVSYFVYVENSDNELVGGGTNTVYAVSMEDGSKTQIYSGDSYVTTLTATVKGNNLETALILDEDADLNTTADTNLYVYGAGQLEKITMDDIVQASAQYHQGVLYWTENDGSSNKLCSYDGNVRSVVTEHPALGTNVKLMSNGNKTAIVWAGVLEDGKYCLYSMVSSGNSWSEPVEIVTTDSYIMQFSGYIAGNGNWELVATAERAEDEVPVLLYTGVAPYLNTKAENIVVLDRNADDTYYSLVADFKNDSETAIDGLTVDFVNPDGKVAFSRKVNCSVKGGESTKLSLDIDIPMIKEYSEYTVYVYPEGEEDITDNAGNVSLGYTDISMKIDEYTSGKTSVLSVSVSNDSDIKTDVTFTVREEDPENGIIIDLVNINDLEPGTKKVFNYKYDLTKMDFEDKASKTYYYSVAADVVELNLTDNSDVIEFLNPFYSEDGEEAVPTGLKMQVPDPVVLTPDMNPTYQIEAEAEPLAASRWPLEYISNDETVVKVDDTGKLSVVGEGTTTVTVRLQNTEIEQQVNVKVEPPVGKTLSLELTEKSVETKGYQVNDIYSINVCSEASKNPMHAELFEYISNNNEVAKVEEDGTVTLLTPGTVVLQAVYKDNAQLKAELSVTVEAQKVGNISLSYSQYGEIIEADSLSSIPQDLKQSPISVIATAFAENGDPMENVSYSFSSDNTKVAKVDEYGNVTATGKEGTAVIYVKAVGSSAVAAFSLNLYTSYSPLPMSGNEITVNIYSNKGVNYALQPIGDSVISSYSSYLYTKNGKKYSTSYDYMVSRIDQNNQGPVTFKITPNRSNLKTKTYYLRTYVEGQYYYTKIKIKATKQLPSVKVSTESFNVFYTDQGGTVKIDTNADISYAYISEVYTRNKLSGAFSTKTISNNEYQLVPTYSLKSGLEKGNKFSRYNRKYKVYVYFSDYNKYVTKTITIPANYKAASVKLDKSNFLVSSKASDSVLAKLSIKNVGENKFSNNIGDVVLGLNKLSGVSVSCSDSSKGLLLFQLPSSLSKAVKGNLTVQQDNWLVPVKVNVKLTPSKNAVYKTEGTVKINPALQQKSLVSVVWGKGQKVALRESELYKDDLFEIKSVFDGIQIQPIADSSKYTKKQYSYNVDVTGVDGDVLGKVSVTISINNTDPKATIVDKELYLDVSQRGRTITTSYNVNDKNVVIKEMKVSILKDGVESTDIRVDTDLDTKVLQIMSQQRVNGVYNIVLTPVLENGKELAAMNLTVYAENGTQITAKTQGTLNAMKRTSSTAKVTLKVQNNSADITKVSIKNAYRSGFEITRTDLKKNVITIAIKSAYDIAGGTHTVPLEVSLDDGSKKTVDALVTVNSSKCTLAKAKALYLYRASNTMVVNGTVKVSKPLDEEVLSIEQISAKEQFTLTDNGSGDYAISVNNKGNIKKGTYSIKCKVHTENELIGSAGIDYTIKVVVK